MSVSNPFQVLDNICTKGDDLYDTTDNTELLDKAYVPFVINRTLSYHYDTVLIANHANLMSHVDKKYQYKFLKSIVRPKKRFAKWAKTENDEFINTLTEIYKCNRQTAEVYASLLTDDQICEIKNNNKTGG